MKRLRILSVAFDTSLQPWQLPQFRGAVTQEVGPEHDWFQNHNNETGGVHQRYPLIQYKIDAYKGQMRPMLLFLNEGIEEAQHFFSKHDWGRNFQLGNTIERNEMAGLCLSTSINIDFYE